MVDKVEGITSEEELKKAQASANAQGDSITNYSDWSATMAELTEYGIETTGSYQGDQTKLKEVQVAVENFINEAQVDQARTQKDAENQKVTSLSETDNEQALKATVANATSSEILANYMKYFHMM
ncbi:MAG: hypothetical protein R3Y28_04185 [Candidatus Gastranaerophilales bacterium]